MELSKFKTELSKLAGIDFHSPKYREIFKRYLGADNAEVDEEEAKANDAQTDEAVETKAAEVIGDVENDKAAEKEGEQPDYTEVNKDETELEVAITDDKEADKEVEKSEADEDKGEKPEPSAEEKRLDEITGDHDGDSESDLDESTEPEPEIAAEAEAAEPAANITDELLTTRLELELVRAGIREDRLETAKRLFMPEFKSSGGNVAEIRELIAQYPEWIGKQAGAQGFGMPLGDKTDALTNEEKALKRMGIDPRN